MMRPGTFEHARVIDTRWGPLLAFIEIRDDDDTECLRLQVWAPVGEGPEPCQVSMRIGLPADASDASHEVLSEINRKVLVDLTAEKAEAAFGKNGMAEMLDQAFEGLVT